MGEDFINVDIGNYLHTSTRYRLFASIRLGIFQALTFARKRQNLFGTGLRP
jgi:hypothetical protein